MKTSKVVIDYDIRGWAKDNEKLITKKYKNLVVVGIHKSLTQDSSDKKIGAYANRYKCDILTSDKTAYVDYFKNKTIQTVEIHKFASYQKGTRPIYLVKIKK